MQVNCQLSKPEIDIARTELWSYILSDFNWKAKESYS